MRGKHAPNVWYRYVEIHEAIMEKYIRDGFVLSNGLVWIPIKGSMLLDGRITCLGRMFIDVEKRLQVLDGEGATAPVQTESYSYNVAIEGRCNVFRYDSPHHGRGHHVHCYDAVNVKATTKVIEIPYEEDRPTLGDVIAEAREWYYEHYDICN